MYDVPITPDAFAALREARAAGPTRIGEVLAGRERRPFLRGDNRLFLVAADHPGRGALAVGSDAMAMANRYELLQRLTIALSRPGVDGVLGTPDIIDDLALLGLLDDKVVVGSINRGGLRGASFEMDDRNTGYSIDGIGAAGLDAGKVLLRVNLADIGCVATIESVANVVTESAAAELPILLEPFISNWVEGRIVNNLSTDAVITSIAIASALGTSSAYSWLKLPVVEDMERVMAATTLPTLLLGGDPQSRPEETYASWEKALALPGVRGLVVGRSLLYPADGDVARAVDTAASLVHA
ncbi:Cgl0159 family (beta/alpha)8-fold protein [Diaminobutyricibacter sp. McL0618]|uniref:Cgl0159 family (beta/alpha)8-fold protein n=1 Tax=Leifsonia sp. McL0618 TaxID=3415677 RepID=UPI003CF1E166